MISYAKSRLNPSCSLYFAEKTMLSVLSPEYFMEQALKEAQKAFEEDEVPVGAVIVYQNRIIARAHNQTECLQDVTAHAEMLAITSAASLIGAKYLHDCTIYVSLEPCPMCAAAMRWAQISALVYGAEDEKNGYMRFGNELLHPKTTIQYGVHEQKCRELLKEFFRKKR
jgi:tRNA(adenine34) deaminase